MNTVEDLNKLINSKISFCFHKRISCKWHYISWHSTGFCGYNKMSTDTMDFNRNKCYYYRKEDELVER